MRISTDTETLLEMMSMLSPAGYFCGMHLHHGAPSQTFVTYPEEWQEAYSDKGYMPTDPLVIWSAVNRGKKRWSDRALQLMDVRGVFKHAAKFDLNYGVIIAIKPTKTKSCCAFSKPDREFSDDEINMLESLVVRLHDATDVSSRLSDTEIETLRLKINHPVEEVAKMQGLSSEGVRKRLVRIYQKLGVDDFTKAVLKLRDAGLL